ncbi:GAF domain-containing protein [Hymenobacter busanensis]|uniref:histidine kinase n=1 Tax=Hymenobacter busanensis TaxID=2607656 RepID=A0A7L5A437_9BACT|nr:ATP-binding protein [Hymenobacter busanensis]KAA9327021.1 GAF domain-containing protein [Hymenobacter busanensis]QHJ09472.1 GAF domain-containing protein [Hymenobacter busanensis]
MDQPRLNYTDESLFGKEITLTNCDREPIHIPGSVQPYGFLLCLDPKTHRVVQVSANVQDYLGLPPQELIDAGLDRLLGPERLAEVETLLPTLNETPKLHGVRLDHVAGQPFFKFILHRYDELLWVELEPVADDPAGAINLPVLNTTLSQMIEADTLQAFCQHTVEQVRGIIGFDRVMMYRFGADESGEVVAEDHAPGLEPFLGLHYPATDIPQQARVMYLKNWLRFIPDVSYAPVPLVPVRNPDTGRPPDMTHAVLRSVSPIHIQYLQNMGVTASMSISLIQDGKLWGMILGHHYSGPRLVGYELRDMCVFVGKTFSALLKGKEEREDQAYQLRIRENQLRLFDLLTESPNFIEGLYQHRPNLLDVIDCGGAAICFEGEIVLLGNTPTRSQVQELAHWMQEHVTQDVFYTNSYAQQNPAGRAFRASASGILGISLAKQPGDYVFWFRPELIQTVTWAGQQQKAEVLQDGQLHLSPRQSFESWKQSVEDTAAPWKPIEIRAAREIRLHISDIRLNVFNELQARAISLARLNTELARSNEELDSFAYVASHDLKEPLRGIHNYSLFLLEDYTDKLDADGTAKLQTLVRLSQRMEALIDSLLQLSRVGRLELAVEDVDVNQVLAGVADLLQPRLEQTGTTLRVEGQLPTLRADRVRLGEILNNLLTNAMRYNDKPEKYVTVGLAAGEVRSPKGPLNLADFHVLYVRDNGIGIDPKHFETIFRLFKRLHSQEKYGGSTGAGLAIVKKMVEKHGGEVWLESVPGRGTTFFFSLSKHL